jgi:hypothetical protein
MCMCIIYSMSKPYVKLLYCTFPSNPFVDCDPSSDLIHSDFPPDIVATAVVESNKFMFLELVQNQNTLYRDNHAKVSFT